VIIHVQLNVDMNDYMDSTSRSQWGAIDHSLQRKETNCNQQNLLKFCVSVISIVLLPKLLSILFYFPEIYLINFVIVPLLCYLQSELCKSQSFSLWTDQKRCTLV
jgi:hypothetical protein